MPGPSTSVPRPTKPVDVAESERFAGVDSQDRNRRLRKVIVRYVVVAAVVVVVFLLVVIAWYYTHGNSVTVRQVSWVATRAQHVSAGSIAG